MGRTDIPGERVLGNFVIINKLSFAIKTDGLNTLESVGPTPHSKPYPEWPWLQLNPNTISLCPSLPPIQVSPILKTGGSSDDRTVKLVIHVLRVSIRACVTDRVGVAGPQSLAACFKQKFKAWQARRMRPVYVPTLRCALPPPDAAQHYCIGAVVCNPDV